jgi:glycosidase
VKKVILGLVILSLLITGCAKKVINTPYPKPTETTIIPTSPVPEITLTLKPENVVKAQTDWWNNSVFYEIFVRSFYDSNGDGIGDFRGLTQKLDYLNDGDKKTTQDLGVTALWLMPIFPSYSYHGYDVTDYMTVNPQYGTMNDFKLLVKEAHSRGIKIIIDLVINHTSDQHPWFKAAQDPSSPYHDYYIWSATDPGYLGPSNQRVWHQAANGQYYYGIFDASMPDLNHRNPAVTEEIHKIVKFWLTDVGIDGFRIDGARHLVEEGRKQVNTTSTHDWFKAFHKFYKRLNPEAVTVGEVWDTSSNIAGYVAGDELDMAFDFDLASAFVQSAAGRSSFLTNTTLANDLPLFQNGLSMATFLSNHDINRSYNSFGNMVDKAKNAATIFLTSPGVPFVYYGEEIGMTGEKPDELIRTPMQWNNEINAGFSTANPWESVNQNYTSVNVEQEQSNPDSLLSFYKKVINIRASNPVLQTGDYYSGSYADSSVFVSLRANGSVGVLTIVNLTNKDIDKAAFSLSVSSLKGTFKAIDLLTGKEYQPITFDQQGGFEKYVPLSTLPANARLVLYLDSVK